jgi:hypothetical protein
MGLEELSAQYGISLEVLEWMKNHTINDLTHIAEGMNTTGIGEFPALRRHIG